MSASGGEAPSEVLVLSTGTRSWLPPGEKRDGVGVSGVLAERDKNLPWPRRKDRGAASLDSRKSVTDLTTGSGVPGASGRSGSRGRRLPGFSLPVSLSLQTSLSRETAQSHTEVGMKATPGRRPRPVWTPKPQQFLPSDSGFPPSTLFLWLLPQLKSGRGITWNPPPGHS